MEKYAKIEAKWNKIFSDVTTFGKNVFLLGRTGVLEFIKYLFRNKKGYTFLNNRNV